MKKTQRTLMAAAAVVTFAPGFSQGEILFREEFDSYVQGSIDGQLGMGLGTTGAWEVTGNGGTFTVGPGLSGQEGLVISSNVNSNVYVAHTVPGWGTGQLWFSYLYNEATYGGHFYVSGGENYAGAFGHPWTTTWGINNEGEGVGYAPKQTYRVVALLDWDAGTTTMWVDPDPSTAPVTDPADASFDAVAYKDEAQATTGRLRIGSWCSGVIDDIIIGTEYADVALAAPEVLPVAPFAVYPTEGEIGILLDETLIWTFNGATTFDVFLWKDGESVPESPNFTTGLASYSFSDLEPRTLYNWRIDSTNEQGTTTGSVFTFVTGDGVSAILPPTGASNVPSDLALSWTSSGAVSYDVYLWEEGEEKPATPTATVMEESYPLESLEPSTNYVWEVVSNYSSGSPTTSVQFTFTSDSGVPGELLLHEEFEDYAPGDLIGQFASGVGLDPSQVWAYQAVEGTFVVGEGLSGNQGVIVTGYDADNTDSVDAKVGHTVEGWGTGVFYMSYLYNQISARGHAYLSGGGSFNGAFGHGWQSFFAIDNVTNPGNVPYAAEQTFRLVAKIDFDAGTTTMWVDPEYEFDDPAAFKTDAQLANPILIIRSAGTDFIVDDVRIGTNFASVIAELDTSVGPDLSMVRNGGNLEFTWTSEDGMIYDLVSSSDLTTAPSTWPVYEDNSEIPADGDGFNELVIPIPSDAEMFFAVKAYMPPPTALFSSDFESDNGGLVAVDYSGGSGTGWAWGSPDSDNGYGSVVDSGNDGSSNVWALNLGTFSGAGDRGFYNTDTDAGLQLAVDLTGVAEATLSFSQALDLDGSDTVAINFLDVNDSNNVVASIPITDPDPNASPWEPRMVAVPSEALGKNILIEWRVISGGLSSEFIGLYLDDISVTTP
ncbi:hypothetical protein AAFN60_09655 [Roseibacillus persicicus]|uniref:hypothetical protein n=1 Tax=Roseibacillus persicicus TaxID=454148 RepID=UPI00398A9734